MNKRHHVALLAQSFMNYGYHEVTYRAGGWIPDIGMTDCSNIRYYKSNYIKNPFGLMKMTSNAAIQSTKDTNNFRYGIEVVAIDLGIIGTPAFRIWDRVDVFMLFLK